jgi:processive 1,2-diacylglycerol beta-glucosyltransferase
MSAAMRELATPSAAATIAGLVLGARVAEPVLILTIANGAGHTRVAEAIAQAIRTDDPATPVSIVDVADYMSFATRMTHVTIYLWLVRVTPRLWAYIDRYQKRQPHTSPEWYYRRGCRRLFRLVGQLRPRVLVATEVGCCEIAALLKRDLMSDCRLLAVNAEYDTDRAWVQPEVDAYSVASPAVADELCALGADRQHIHAWGVPLSPEFHAPLLHGPARVEARRQLGLDLAAPVILVSGGSEGLGRPDLAAARLLRIRGISAQVVVLTGRNTRLKRRCETLAAACPPGRLRTIGWTTRVADWMRVADLLVSKPGHTFDEAIACELPFVSLPPPPGSEEVQYALLDRWNVGRAVRNLDQLEEVCARLLSDAGELAAIRDAARLHRRRTAAQQVSRWICASAGAPSTALAAGLVR